jgi:nucleoid DNA-binding protein
MAKETVAKKMTKAAVLSEVADKTGLTRKQVGEVFEALRTLMKQQLGKRGGPEQFEIPGIVRLKIRRVEARKGVKFRNPATGETVVRDVAASRKLRATPVKALKDLVL